MVHWQNPEVLALTSYLFTVNIALSLGFYGWYFILSLHKVEFGLVTRRIRFQLVHVCYLIARYAHLISLIAIFATSNMKNSPTYRCSGLGLLRLVSVTDDLALAASSGNLALRAMVLWKDKRAASWILRILCAGHMIYAVVLGLAGVRQKWDPVHQTCVLDADAARKALVGFLMCTITWDVSILALTVSGIRRKGLLAAWPLWPTLAIQGASYVLITLLTCISVSVLYLLNLNEVMNIFLLPPGCTISVIVSSSAVSSLLSINEEGQRVTASS
ncbi:uncharacterized protein PHACADRAFT_259457, partial [Phanerochaete carnosa HHB-10118-sp]